MRAGLAQRHDAGKRGAILVGRCGHRSGEADRKAEADGRENAASRDEAGQHVTAGAGGAKGGQRRDGGGHEGLGQAGVARRIGQDRRLCRAKPEAARGVVRQDAVPAEIGHPGPAFGIEAIGLSQRRLADGAGKTRGAVTDHFRLVGGRQVVEKAHCSVSRVALARISR